MRPGVAEATPGTAAARDTTCWALPAEVTTTVGSALPAGKDRPMRSAAAIASGFWRNCSLVGSPVRTCVRPTLSAPSRARPATTKTTGRADTRRPMRCQTEWSESTSAACPSRGTSGQNTQRPKSTSVVGRTTRAKTMATTTPTAQASPSPRVVGTTESRRVSSPRTTVVALARTASPA